MPLAPQEGVQVPFAQAFHGLRELALEGKPPQLAVGDHLQSGFLLELDGLGHGAIFDRFEFAWRNAAGGRLFPRLQELGRPQQTVDMVCMDGDHPPSYMAKLWCGTER